MRVATGLLGLIAVILVAWALRASYAVSMPLALSFFVTLIVLPVKQAVATRVHRRLRWLGVVAAMGCVIAGIGLIALAIYFAISMATARLPEYTDDISRRWQNLLETAAEAGIPVDTLVPSRLGMGDTAGPGTLGPGNTNPGEIASGNTNPGNTNPGNAQAGNSTPGADASRATTPGTDPPATPPGGSPTAAPGVSAPGSPPEGVAVNRGPAASGPAESAPANSASADSALAGSTSAGSTSADSTSAKSSPAASSSAATRRSTDLLMSIAADIVTRAYQFIAFLVLTFFFVLLMLIEAPQWRRKTTEVAGDPGSRHRARDVLLTIGSKVRRFLVVRTLIGLTTAVLEGIWLWSIGVPLALVWAVIFLFLNYIPTLGSIIAAIPPVLFALATMGFGWALVAAAGILIIEQIMGNYVDPAVQGRQLSISPLVVLVAVVFWGWIWGVGGALLAVPITMSLIVAAAHIEPLVPIALMLSGASDKDELIDATTKDPAAAA